MATTNSVTLTLGYEGTNFTRKYKFTDVEAGALSSVKAKVLAYNAAVPTADKNVFISDDYDATDIENVIGKCAGIVAAYYETREETDIPLDE